MENTFFDIDYQIANSDYGILFHAVQLSGFFPDSKTFPDCNPKQEMAEITKNFIASKDKQSFDLEVFINRNFELPKVPSNDFVADTSITLAVHINNLWPYLTIKKSTQQGTYLSLPKPFVVPGGRFQELYYWDSYFTCLGLFANSQFESIEHILDNFTYLIDTFGFVPNGNRSYFLSRSQPPFFALLVDLFSKYKGDNVFEKYLPSLLKEYDFWMKGAENQDNTNIAINRTVKVETTILNRYWDKLNTPRPESYKEDYELAKILKDKPELNTDPQYIYRNIRAAAESGWDFSSRWFADEMNMETIQTIDLLPVDLNCLLYFLEKTIAEAFLQKFDSVNAQIYLAKSEKRKAIIQELFWEKDFFYDYNFKTKKLSVQKTLAACFPLFFEIATESQAKKVAEIIEKDFLKNGGLVTTLNNTGQQWDWPNGWAPLQWIAYQGFMNYGFVELAEKIRLNWLDRVMDIYQKEGKLTEKYDVVNKEKLATGGEYPNQDGFGWTNGVTMKFLSL